jgi:hypothetical protein
MIVALMLAVLSGAVYRALTMTMWQLEAAKLQTAAAQQAQQQIETLRGIDMYRIGAREGDNVGYINYNVTENDYYNPTEDVLLTNSVVLSDGGALNVSGDNVPASILTEVWNIDDTYDGLGADDADGNTNDYKRLRLTMVWEYRGRMFTNVNDTYVYGMNWDNYNLDDDWRLRTLGLPTGLPAGTKDTTDTKDPT